MGRSRGITVPSGPGSQRLARSEAVGLPPQAKGQWPGPQASVGLQEAGGGKGFCTLCPGEAGEGVMRNHSRAHPLPSPPSTGSPRPAGPRGRRNQSQEVNPLDSLLGKRPRCLLGLCPVSCPSCCHTLSPLGTAPPVCPAGPHPAPTPGQQTLNSASDKGGVGLPTGRDAASSAKARVCVLCAEVKLSLMYFPYRNHSQLENGPQSDGREARARLLFDPLESEERVLLGLQSQAKRDN